MNSKEHITFLNNLKREKIIINIARIFIIISFLIIWQLLASNNVINTFLFSSPSRIIKTIYGLFINNKLLGHIRITLTEILISFILSAGIGIIIASLMWSCRLFYRIIDPYITVLNSLPKVALGPLVIIWFGASMKSIVFMSLLISIFVTIINIYQGFISTNKDYITMIKSFGANKWQIFRYIVFPNNYNNIISALKVNISMNFIGVIMGELLVSKKGLGYLIMYGSQIFNIDLVITCIFILGFISYIMYLFINKKSRH